MRKPKQTPSVAYYVQDACGDKYCFTVADAEYEPAFRSHARWWMRTGYKQTAEALRKEGNHHRSPVKPFKVVVEPSDA